jgi:hypothetical protein
MMDIADLQKLEVDEAYAEDSAPANGETCCIASHPVTYYNTVLITFKNAN